MYALAAAQPAAKSAIGVVASNILRSSALDISKHYSDVRRLCARSPRTAAAAENDLFNTERTLSLRTRASWTSSNAAVQKVNGTPYRRASAQSRPLHEARLGIVYARGAVRSCGSTFGPYRSAHSTAGCVRCSRGRTPPASGGRRRTGATRRVGSWLVARPRHGTRRAVVSHRVYTHVPLSVHTHHTPHYALQIYC